MSAAFTGANGEMGIEFYRGLMAYIDHLNDNGGAGGWKIRIQPANDGYNPAPCFRNTVRFVKDDNVFALFSYVGTPTTTHILPLLQKFHADHAYLLFPLTGAQPLRTPPFGDHVYNLRASYFEETAGLVDHLTDIGLNRIAVFYQNDAYGRTGWDGVRRALKKHDLNIVGQAAYKRGASYDQSFNQEVDILMTSKPDVIICIGTYASQGALIRDLRNAGYNLPVAGVSFADSDKMLELLQKQGAKDGRDYTAKLINSQVVPSYEDISLKGVRLYRALMDNYKGMPMITSQPYRPRRFSYVSFEGFLNGMMLGEVVRRMADDPRPERLPEIFNSIDNFDLGIGVNANFSEGRHQGLHEVYFTTVRDGAFLPIIDWERWSK
ncbi:ABC transporter substrate-binding protein [Pseudodesulfovibrio sp. zrk46]|uniref:ABC transporter substrate-binding protein n=1 Tax=Pseudodesulfovibrio sp. zrk46 TaxID=2725288 RepID=UPI00144A1BC1|nr:ABC transporter substrate-binding protein [Pseudodesulfovibrio sp. zrk46]QJB55598.1 ABC transporter substrate-binding protein [Pseudodesulfovibrio sp. zrk46]